MESVTPTNWWNHEPLRELSSIVSHINNASAQSDHVESCSAGFSAFNLLWTQLYRFQRRNGHLKPEHVEQGRGDTASFEELLRVTLAPDEKTRLLQSNAVKRLAALALRVMSHDILRREDYDPSAIPDRLRERASEKHSELAHAFEKWCKQQTPQSAEKAIKKLADLLFVIRSNIAHGEKTPDGPDLEKATRDQKVCQAARPVMAAISCAIFNHPSRRLAVYGTLLPGEPNHSILARLQGAWRDARIRGHVVQRDGLPHFVWNIAEPQISAKVFETVELEEKWPDLDRFEGRSYQRVWVVASLDGDEQNVTNIYSLRSEATSSGSLE